MVLSVVHVIDETFLSYESCQENQTEEQETEEEERNTEVEGLLLDQFFVSSLCFDGYFADIVRDLSYKNIHREILTPPPRV